MEVDREGFSGNRMLATFGPHEVATLVVCFRRITAPCRPRRDSLHVFLARAVS